jgi:dipeptidyl aminopeptidase/acylaminoacyl peptidase
MALFCMNKLSRWSLTAALLAGVSAQVSAEPAPMPLDKAAAIFGARPAVDQMSLSPDGSRIAYVGAGEGQMTVLMIGDLAKGEIKPITYTDNKPVDLKYCDWASNDRLVCQSYGLDILYGKRVSYTRLFAIDADGKNVKSLAAPHSADALRPSQYDGVVIDYLDRDGHVLIARDHVPTQTTGTLVGSTGDGIGVDLVDVRSNAGKAVVRPRDNASEFISDGKGHVRIMGIDRVNATGVNLTGQTAYLYRQQPEGAWQPFSSTDQNRNGLEPIAVDADLNVAYALKKKDGRAALYRVALDGSMKEELVLDDPRVDVDGVVMIGGRVIGASYTTDRSRAVYFDPAYRQLAQQLERALPNTPLIDFVASSRDGGTLVIHAGSDTDAGRFYLFQKSTHKLQGLMSVRPQADGLTLAKVQSISYKSFDGTEVPAYLTLPPGSSGKNLPAIVMPHGGPESRDVWGFDPLVQFFAMRGFAVIQPEFRGSTGFGESWFLNNGFRSWRQAIGDVNAAGKWLVAQGIADPAKLAIFGWSYGGYAALQSNVLQPDLFKAVVAVAPVTDLSMLRRESEGFTDEELEKARIGSGPALDEASPARHADIFRAPVLLFHGDRDINVGFAESQAMNEALRRAGKQSELVRYPGLDHQLADSKALTDMLTRSDNFLRSSLHLQ